MATAKQIAAAKTNLAKARAARKRNQGQAARSSFFANHKKPTAAEAKAAIEKSNANYAPKGYSVTASGNLRKKRKKKVK